jgi:hypothetical protein
MAANTLNGLNIQFPIYNADGTAFHGIVLHKSTYESVVMSLGDKITGEVYYPNNSLVVTMQEYIVYDGVKYTLVNPPTIIKEGIVSDNGDANGMTKYSFVFFHPMYMLGNFPFTDVAVSNDELKYKAQDTTFYWIGNLNDYVAKINKNLQGLEWACKIGSNVSSSEREKMSEVLSFDKSKISDALKTGYETWGVPYIIYKIPQSEPIYAQGKRFMILFGLPYDEITDTNGEPYVFRYGQGVGLKNNSRTPRNNKIVTRIAGYGSETNIPYGYPQIVWTGNQSWKYTINNDPTANNSYMIYDGIVGGANVKLIKHPFTRNHLMPSVYAETVNKKVNPNATGYDPDIEIKDYYDAVNGDGWSYPNIINPSEPSYHIQEFEDIKPELGEKRITGVEPWDEVDDEYITYSELISNINAAISATTIQIERLVLTDMKNKITSGLLDSSDKKEDGSYFFEWEFTSNSTFIFAKYISSNVNFEYTALRNGVTKKTQWDDSMDGDGNYLQSYFKITLPTLDFDLYACAAITQEMSINMRSGACLGCTFTVMVDWDDYKRNFYDEDGNFAPNGNQRDMNKYPNTSNTSVTFIVQKDKDTFGTLMPNVYQKPNVGDKFVILGISLPTSYITNAEARLDTEMKQYMLNNNEYYFDYPLKFDEYFLANNTNILNQIKPNVVVRFDYGGVVHALYVKQETIKFENTPLPTYDISLTDDVEIVLNQIGQTVDEMSKLRKTIDELKKDYNYEIKPLLIDLLTRTHTLGINANDMSDNLDLTTARAKASEYLRQALDSDTEVYGGLILTTLIALRDINGDIWSGINGAYDASDPRGGIAAWFGGGMIDHEEQPSLANYAKSLFRFDGSGYLAGGNISWDSGGDTTYNGVVRAALMYSGVKYIGSGDYNIDLENEPAYLFFKTAATPSDTITLPSASNYEGVELRIFARKTITSAPVTYTIKCKSGDYIGIHTNNEGIIEVNAVSSYTAQVGVLYVLQSVNNNWMLIQGDDFYYGANGTVTVGGVNMNFYKGRLTSTYGGGSGVSGTYTIGSYKITFTNGIATSVTEVTSN